MEKTATQELEQALVRFITEKSGEGWARSTVKDMAIDKVMTVVKEMLYK
jgi:hypothetical protein